MVGGEESISWRGEKDSRADKELVVWRVLCRTGDKALSRAHNLFGNYILS